MNILSLAFISLGIFFLIVAAVGTLRLPDFYTRAHALSVTDTLASFLILFGLVFHFGFSIITLKLIFIVVFINVANPTITHVLFRAALRSGLKPWTKNNV